MMAKAIEVMQSKAQSRYKQDLNGALFRAIENQFGAGATQGNTELNGLAARAADLLGGANTGLRETAAYDAADFVLAFAPAP